MKQKKKIKSAFTKACEAMITDMELSFAKYLLEYEKKLIENQIMEELKKEVEIESKD